MTHSQQLLEIVSEAKKLARKYRELTQKPLGITGEVAELEAARILDLELAPPRQAGYDAIERIGPLERKLQIKGRCILDTSKRGQRVGAISLDKDWDAVLLVLLDEDFNAVEIWEADRAAIGEILNRPGSKARERGQMAIRQFKAKARRRWPMEEKPHPVPGRCRGMLTIVSEDDEHLNDWADYLP